MYRGFFVLIACSVGFFGCIETSPDYGPASNFDDLFSLISKEVVVGTEDFPLFYSSTIIAVDSSIFFPDVIGKKLLAFRIDKNEWRSVSSAEDERCPFVLPVSIAVDSQNSIYLLDRQASTVCIFDLDLKYENRIPLIGELNESVFIYDDDVYVTGMTNRSRRNFLVQQYSKESGYVPNIYGVAERSFVIYSWASTIDENGILSLINVTDTRIRSFASDGSELKAIEIDSPSINTLSVENMPESEEVWFEYFKTVEHTRITSLVAQNDVFFVQHRWFALSSEQEEFVLDIFARDGELLHHGVLAPGIVATVKPGELSFINLDKKNSGIMSISYYRYKG